MYLYTSVGVSNENIIIIIYYYTLVRESMLFSVCAALQVNLPSFLEHRLPSPSDSGLVSTCKAQRLVARLDLEEKWKFHLRDEYQTDKMNPLFFHCLI